MDSFVQKKARGRKDGGRDAKEGDVFARAIETRGVIGAPPGRPKLAPPRLGNIFYRVRRG